MKNSTDLTKQNKEIDTQARELQKLNQKIERDYGEFFDAEEDFDEGSDVKKAKVKDAKAAKDMKGGIEGEMKDTKSAKNLKDELKQKIDEATDQKEQEIMTEEFDASLAEVMSDVIDEGKRE